MNVSLWGWVFAIGVILALLAIDLAANRGDRSPTLRRALIASAAWIGISVIFGLVLGAARGQVAAQQYFAAYLVEKSLSIDNVFVFALLFQGFAVPRRFQHRVLYYGVIGALVLRAAFIAGGSVLVGRFAWILYIFGALLVIAGIRMVFDRSEKGPERNPMVRAAQHVLSVTPEYADRHFFVRRAGRWVATPLVIALVAIETSDLIFATDSIPAIFGITTDVFIIFMSNAFAVLGLRALYFVFADSMHRFRYLRYGLAVLLGFIGIRMLMADVVTISVPVSLATIVLIISTSVAASLWARPGRAVARRSRLESPR
ncbi:MAG: TerC/Alx family metal homeostasis membrane protein [Acidimicrobiales bacterium]